MPKCYKCKEVIDGIPAIKKCKPHCQSCFTKGKGLKSRHAQNNFMERMLLKQRLLLSQEKGKKHLNSNITKD